MKNDRMKLEDDRMKLEDDRMKLEDDRMKLEDDRMKLEYLDRIFLMPDCQPVWKIFLLKISPVKVQVIGHR